MGCGSALIVAGFCNLHAVHSGSMMSRMIRFGRARGPFRELSPSAAVVHIVAIDLRLNSMSSTASGSSSTTRIFAVKGERRAQAGLWAVHGRRFPELAQEGGECHGLHINKQLLLRRWWRISDSFQTLQMIIVQTAVIEEGRSAIKAASLWCRRRFRSSTALSRGTISRALAGLHTKVSSASFKI